MNTDNDIAMLDTLKLWFFKNNTDLIFLYYQKNEKLYIYWKNKVE